MYQSRSNAKRTPSRGYAATPASAKTQQDALFLGSLRPLFGLRSVILNYTLGGPRCLQCSESDESAMNIGRILFTKCVEWAFSEVRVYSAVRRSASSW